MHEFSFINQSSYDNATYTTCKVALGQVLILHKISQCAMAIVYTILIIASLHPFFFLYMQQTCAHLNYRYEPRLAIRQQKRRLLVGFRHIKVYTSFSKNTHYLKSGIGRCLLQIMQTVGREIHKVYDPSNSCTGVSSELDVKKKNEPHIHILQ